MKRFAQSAMASNGIFSSMVHNPYLWWWDVVDPIWSGVWRICAIRLIRLEYRIAFSATTVRCRK